MIRKTFFFKIPIKNEIKILHTKKYMIVLKNWNHKSDDDSDRTSEKKVIKKKRQ